MISPRPSSGPARTYPPPALASAGKPWLWMAGFAALSYLLALHALTPVVPDTSFSLISLPVALLALALMVRPWAEAPFYALIHAAAGLGLHAGTAFPAFAAARIALEIVESAVLVRMLLDYFYARLNDPPIVALYAVAVLFVTAIGGLILLAIAQLLVDLGVEAPPILIDRPALAWRFWWLGHACSYLTLAGPIAVILALRQRLARILLERRPERRALLMMAGSLLVAALIAFPIADMSSLGLAADVRLSLTLIPLPFALAMAARFRANGASSALLLLTPIVLLSVTGPNAAANWAGLPSTATPTQALLLMLSTACMVLGAISRQLLKANSDALQASQAKTRFVAMLNHELRTPLNAILGFSELMRMQKIRDIDEAMAPLDNIHASGQRLLAMIEGLVNQADHGASAFDLHKHSLEVNQLVVSVIEELQSELTAFRYPVTIAIPPELRIEADPRALKQILMVLIAYPLRFVTPWTQVSATAEQLGTNTILEIDSRGLVGAANDDRDKLELQLVMALALAHGARLTITHSGRDRRQARLTFFATKAAA